MTASAPVAVSPEDPAASFAATKLNTLDELATWTNWKIQQLFALNEFDQCLTLIESVLNESKGQSEFALYIKGKIMKHTGRIDEALELFQAAATLCPSNHLNLKQVARCLFLLGRFEAALTVYEEAEKLGGEQWDIWQNKGLCHWRMRRQPEALECFHSANMIQRHDATYLLMGKLLVEMNELQKAIAVYSEALEFSPDNSHLLTTLGLLYMKTGESFKGFENLGNSLTHDAGNARTILAAGSIIQDHNDTEVALIKYRVAAKKIPASAQLWNNIGMCFYTKQKYVAATSCLKRALYLDPFEWIISYNLAMTHLQTRQFASAYHHFSASINLQPDNAASYMYLAIALSHLGDAENTCNAFAKALELDSGSFLINLNFAVTLLQLGDRPRCAEQYNQFVEKWSRLDETQQSAHPAVKIQRSKLEAALGIRLA
ncbi:unnamed protein product (mitochondrion) [Plasmodiophora brassicae]|nr:unnamed protein product [Plasmodiophora brassicae]